MSTVDATNAEFVPAERSLRSHREDTALLASSASASDALRDGNADGLLTTAGLVRERLGWQKNFFPPVQNSSGYRTFRMLCDSLVAETKELRQFVADGQVTEYGFGAIAEVSSILDELYECQWGESECLKNIVVAVRFQIGNVRWTEAHVAFLEELAVFLRARYLIDDDVVEMCYDMVDAHGLDVFRGTISEPEVVREFKVVEVTDDGDVNITTPYN